MKRVKARQTRGILKGKKKEGKLKFDLALGSVNENSFQVDFALAFHGLSIMCFFHFVKGQIEIPNSHTPTL